MEKGKINFVIIICICFLIISCSKGTNISSYINNTDNDFLDLQEFTNKKIDCVYIFGEYTDNNEISKITGSKYYGDIIQDSQYLLLLISDKEVVYKELFNEKNFEFSRKDKSQYKSTIYRKYNSNKFKIDTKSNKFKVLTPIN